MKFNYEAYERLFPRHEAERVKAEIKKDQEQGNVLEEVEKPKAKQDPVRDDIIPDIPSEPNEGSGVINEPDNP